jgi:ribosomal protein L37AE/L43A
MNWFDPHTFATSLLVLISISFSVGVIVGAYVFRLGYRQEKIDRHQTRKRKELCPNCRKPVAFDGKGGWSCEPCGKWGVIAFPPSWLDEQHGRES